MEVLQTQCADRVAYVPVVSQRLSLTILTVHKMMEVAPSQYLDRVVDEMTEVASSLYLDRVVDVPVAMQRHTSVTLKVTRMAEIPEMPFADSGGDVSTQKIVEDS